MTFFQSIATVFRKYADFTGRATRAEYWWFALFTFIVSSVLNALTPFSMNRNMFEVGATATSFTGYMSLAGAWSLAVLVPSLAVGVRRLRDAGRNWTELFWVLVPIVGAIILIVHLCDPTTPATESAAVPSTPATPTD